MNWPSEFFNYYIQAIIPTCYAIHQTHIHKSLVTFNDLPGSKGWLGHILLMIQDLFVLFMSMEGRKKLLSICLESFLVISNLKDEQIGSFYVLTKSILKSLKLILFFISFPFCSIIM